MIIASVTNSQVFTEGILGQPTNLTPHLGRQNEVDQTICTILYPQLVRSVIGGGIAPSLAKSWTVSENGLQYHLFLRDDLFWSNGRKINADDVLFTAQNSSAISGVEVQKVNDFEVKFSLKEPYAPFLNVLTLRIIPQEASPGLEPITLAQRRIARIVRSGKRIDKILIYNQYAANTELSFISFVFFDRVSDMETAAHLGEIAAFSAPEFNDDNFFLVEYALQARRYGLFFNLENDLLKDSTLRYKLAESVDKAKVIDQALAGLGEEINLPEIAFNETPGNGYTDSITITVPNEKAHLKTAKLVKEDWEELGLNVTILPLPFWDISTRVIDTKDFQILLFGQELTNDPDEYTLWHSTKTSYPGLNISQLNNQRVDQALEDGRQEMDPESRLEHYDNFRTIFNEEIPALFLYRPKYRWYVSKRYQDLLEQYVIDTTCCDGCKCFEYSTPQLYYPSDRFKLLPL